jgi:thymidine kinase
MATALGSSGAETPKGEVAVPKTGAAGAVPKNEAAGAVPKTGAAGAVPKSELEPYGGSIELILGPMFSEKSTELIGRIRRAALADQPVVLVKHAKDVRYEEGAIVATHAELRQPSASRSEIMAPIRVVRAEQLSELVITEPVVGIDEGQFFPDLAECSERWANEGRVVIIAALDGDFSRRPFGAGCAMIPLAEKTTKLRGVCMRCRCRESAFTLRLGESKELELIGGRESYHSVCRKCYFASAASTVSTVSTVSTAST